MKALYAVTFVCLSLPAFADDVTPIRADEDNAVTAGVPASQPTGDQSIVDFHVDETNMRPIADVLDITLTRTDEDNTSTVDVPAVQPSEDHSVVDFSVDEHNVAPVTALAATPIDGAEFEGTSRDDDYAVWTIQPTLYYLIDTKIEDENNTADVTSPAWPEVDDNPINPSPDFLASEGTQEVTLSETIGQLPTEADVRP
jgi:hypothetical protein